MASIFASIVERNFENAVRISEINDTRKRRLRKLVKLFLMFTSNALAIAFPERRMWAKIRGTDWWDNVLNTWDDMEWKDNFRVDKSTFDTILRKVKPYITKKKVIREPVSPKKRLAIMLARLDSSGELKNIAHLFGVSKPAVCIILKETCAIFATKIKQIVFPQGEVLYEITNSFLGNNGLPGVCGAIDGTHIPIKAPKKTPKDYFNRKQYYSVVLQGIVDHQKKFINVYFGWPGSVHDARVLANSTIFTKCENGLFDNYQIQLPGTIHHIKPFLVGDPAYPLKMWLMKPFSGGSLSPSEEKFNKILSGCRVSVEHAFGMLKGRWRILLKTNETVNLTNLKNQVITCCILHNICQEVQDSFLYEWTTDNDEDHEQVHSYTTNDATTTNDAKLLRQKLVNWCNINL